MGRVLAPANDAASTVRSSENTDSTFADNASEK